MDNINLTPQEEKFCLVYACGPSPYNGNAQKTYDLVFNKKTGKLMNPEVCDSLDEVNQEVDSKLAARKLMLRDEIRDRIDQLQSESVVNASTLRPRLTETLLKIADECSTLLVQDKFGLTLSPAAMRAVAVNAISKLTDMYGIKEDIAHKVTLENGNGDGITFNLIAPESSKDNEVTSLDV